MSNRKRLPVKNAFLEKQLVRRRLGIAIIFLLFLLLCLLVRLLYLSGFQHEYYQGLMNQNRYKMTAIPPARGEILDRNGVVLARNKPVFQLVIVPSKTDNLQNTLKRLSAIIPINPQEKTAFLKQVNIHYKTDAVPLKLNLTQAELSHFSVRAYQFPGVSVKAALMRVYPLGKPFEDVVGYVGRINETELQHINRQAYANTNFIGKRGIEQYYESILHGTVGYQTIEVDAHGKTLKTVKVQPPIAGSALTLTLDSRLQLAAYHAFQNNNGALVAIDPNNGQILAFVSHPGYDPNLFVKGISQAGYNRLLHDPNNPLFNRALRGYYPMASTIKPFLSIGALSKHIVSPNDTIFDPGYFKLKNSHHIFHDWKLGGHGVINISRAITVSCDTYFYHLANLMGIQTIDQILRSFGFGQVPKIDLPNALGGTVPSPAWKRQHTGQPWYPGDTIITGIGQGFTQITPLQLADGIAAIAMRGKRFQPTLLLKQTTAKQTQLTQAPIPLTAAPFHDPSVWQIVIHAMQNVINSNEGTGFRFGRHPPFSAAGKTGTAQVVSLRKHNAFAVVPKRFRNDSLFMVFAPIQHPKIAVAVIAEHTTQAPAIARRVLDAYFKEHTQ